jgi:hypothetical protein
MKHAVHLAWLGHATWGNKAMGEGIARVIGKGEAWSQAWVTHATWSDCDPNRHPSRLSSPLMMNQIREHVDLILVRPQNRREYEESLRNLLAGEATPGFRKRVAFSATFGCRAGVSVAQPALYRRARDHGKVGCPFLLRCEVSLTNPSQVLVSSFGDRAHSGNADLHAFYCYPELHASTACIGALICMGVLICIAAS